MPDRMPDRMPENMSDRMPEDLPVTKCINVMVGITRSKVIFHSVGNVIIPTATHSIIFQRGRYTTNQLIIELDDEKIYRKPMETPIFDGKNHVFL